MNKNIAVIGAGPMGLAVAYQLVQDGYTPVIYEADDRIGGMTASFDFNGLNIERYYHFHCTSDVDFLQILDELNISQEMNWAETKMSYFYKNRLQPWGNPVALFLFKGLDLFSKIRYGLFAFLSTKRKKWDDLDKLEATNWIKKWVGMNAWDLLWRQLFDLKFYEFSNNLSAAWIWSRIHRIGNSRYNLMKEKLGYLNGGSSTLLKSLENVINNKGGRIVLNARIEKICIEKDIVQGVIGPKGFIKHDVVFSTIALPYVAKIMPDLPVNILNMYKSKKNIAVVCVIVKLKKSLTKSFWLNITDDSMKIPGVVEYSNLMPMKDKIVYIPYYMPNDNPLFRQTDQEFINIIKGYLVRINKDITENDIIDCHVNRVRYAQPICEPNYLKTLPPVKLPIEGLFVADTSYYYPEDRGISESIGFGRKMAKMI
jgi:protoporphyrinogen oxidase